MRIRAKEIVILEIWEGEGGGGGRNRRRERSIFEITRARRGKQGEVRRVVSRGCGVCSPFVNIYSRRIRIIVREVIGGGRDLYKKIRRSREIESLSEMIPSGGFQGARMKREESKGDLVGELREKF